MIPYVEWLKDLKINQLQSIVIETRFAGYVKTERQTVERLIKLEKKNSSWYWLWQSRKFSNWSSIKN